MSVTSLSELLRLPANARADLAMALWESLSEVERDRALPLDPALMAELDRRWADHLAKPETAVPWEEVQRKLRS
jgi:putative addiction module component (TIGR02574 family)